jgi:hypothetical protein
MRVSPCLKIYGKKYSVMPRRPTRLRPAADWPHEKTLNALRRQLADLQRFKGSKYREARNPHSEWFDLTASILRHGFGEDSTNYRNLFFTGNALGEYDRYTPTETKEQLNFEARVIEEESCVRSTIKELELMLPEPEIAGAYEPGEEYQFYWDLKTIVGFSARELFITDNYLDAQLFDVYMANVSPAVAIRVLTNQVSGSVQPIAEKFSKRGKFELRSSKDVHDRVVFADDRCWVIGQSIKDAAKKKPTYVVEHSGAATMKGIYELIWAGATTIVKS